MHTLVVTECFQKFTKTFTWNDDNVALTNKSGQKWNWQHTVCTYCNYPFFIIKVFSDGIRYLKICYMNITPVRIIFSIAILSFGRWLMVVPPINHGNSVPDNRVNWVFRVSQSSPTATAYLSIFVHMITKHAAIVHSHWENQFTKKIKCGIFYLDVWKRWVMWLPV